MKSYSTLGFKPPKFTVDSLLSGNSKPVFSVRTLKAEYSGNTLDSALCLWIEHRNEDTTQVQAIHCVG